MNNSFSYSTIHPRNSYYSIFLLSKLAFTEAAATEAEAKQKGLEMKNKRNAASRLCATLLVHLDFSKEREWNTWTGWVQYVCVWGWEWSASHLTQIRIYLWREMIIARRSKHSINCMFPSLKPLSSLSLTFLCSFDGTQYPSLCILSQIKCYEIRGYPFLTLIWLERLKYIYIYLIFIRLSSERHYST